MPPRLRKACPSYFQPPPPSSRCQCLRQPNPRPFSSTARNPTRQRRIMFSWLNGPGANFRNPLPGSTNYLNAYDPNGRLVRATNRERRSDSENSEDEAAGLSTEKNLQGDEPIPKESLDDLMPFPMNRQFRSQSVLSEDFKDEIYKRWQNGDSVRRVSADLQVEMRRVGAVIRLKAVEEQWKSQVCSVMFSFHPLRQVDKSTSSTMMSNSISLEDLSMVTNNKLQLSETSYHTPIVPFNRRSRSLLKVDNH